MHTAGFARDQGIDTAVVPGNVTSPTSKGTNNLLVTNQAAAITSTDDVMHLLGLPGTTAEGRIAKRVRGSNQQEQLILDLIEKGINDGSAILRNSRLSVEQFSHHLTMLEITAKIRPLGNNLWALR